MATQSLPVSATVSAATSATNILCVKQESINPAADILHAKRKSLSHEKTKTPGLSLNLSSITGEKIRVKSVTPTKIAVKTDENQK